MDFKSQGRPKKIEFLMGRLESSGMAPWKKIYFWAHNGTASPSNDPPPLLMSNLPPGPKQHDIPINALQHKRSGQDT